MLEFLAANPVAAFGAMFADPSNRWFALYLASSVVFAFVVYQIQARRDPETAAEGFLGFAFPRELWSHPSTRLDLVYWIINKTLFATLLVGTSYIALVIDRGIGWLTQSLPLEGLVPAPLGVAIAATTLGMVLAFDFGLWLAHYLGHRVPFLWEFHKVHHSVEVLTPLAAGRVHPVDDVLSLVFAGLFSGLSMAGARILFGADALVLNAFQAHIVLLAFYLLGFHLRHSHVWLPYTGWLGHLLISPAHHQVHHSAEERHWDRNMGFIFAIWDWMFGTLWVPAKEKESFRLGLGGEEREFSSVARLYLRPFAKIGARLAVAARPRGARPAGSPESAA
ncbi:MAG TPA: sterol desaturase family protein [Salinarimonas sp.]|nr:sterol desaturase family protein [Salinarimonas sp.]